MFGQRSADPNGDVSITEFMKALSRVTKLMMKLQQRSCLTTGIGVV